jgi:hypothetical protein
LVSHYQSRGISASRINVDRAAWKASVEPITTSHRPRASTVNPPAFSRRSTGLPTGGCADTRRDFPTTMKHKMRTCQPRSVPTGVPSEVDIRLDRRISQPLRLSVLSHDSIVEVRDQVSESQLFRPFQSGSICADPSKMIHL